MKGLIKITSAILLVVIALLAISCNSGAARESEVLSEGVSDEMPTEDKTEKKTEKKTQKVTEKETRHIKATESPTMLEDLDGLDLNLKVLTQNVRYADDPNGNSVKERTTRFGALLDEYKPDLVGTQEVTVEWYNYLSSLENYALIGSSKTGRKAESGEWNVIMYNVDRFVVMDSDTFWLTDTPDRVSQVKNASGVRICTWAELYDRYTGETIIMANTHIDHKNTDVRVQQLNYLFKHLRKRLFERYEDCRIYLTGDFNCAVNSRPYMIATTSKFVDTRAVTLEDNSKGKVSFHGYNGQEYMFDYCFFKGDDTVLSYEIITKNYIGEMDTEPGFVSDHYGVISVFERKATK